MFFSIHNYFFAQINVDKLDYGENHFKVDSIKIVGNNITENFIITNELTFNVGDTIKIDDLNFNKERIYSLGLFNHVSLNKSVVNNKNIVTIELEESWYIFPLPLFGIKEKDIKKLYYGFLLVYKNFRGRNETIFSAATFGYNPSFGITYSNPNLFSRKDYFLTVSTKYSNLKNRSIIAEKINNKEFHYKNFSASLLLGKRFDIYNKIFGTIAYNYIEVADANIRYTSKTERIDRYPYLSVGYEFDSRDLIQFPKQGKFFYSGTNLIFFGNSYSNYFVNKIDFRNYFELFDYFLVKQRFYSRFTIGSNIPIYDYSIIGTEEKIRGNFFKRIENRNLITFNNEIYFPLIKDAHLDFSFIPIIPDQLLSYRFAIYFQTFADYGSVFKNFFNNKNSLFGFGAGLTILVLPYNIIRFELGFNEKFSPQFIIDLGTSF